MVSPPGKHSSDSPSLTECSTSLLITVNEAFYDLGLAYLDSLISLCCYTGSSNSKQPMLPQTNCYFAPVNISLCCSTCPATPPCPPGNCPSLIFRPAGTCSGKFFPLAVPLSVPFSLCIVSVPCILHLPVFHLSLYIILFPCPSFSFLGL